MTTIEILSTRRYGEPKLKMPKELKGIKKAGSVPWNSKCACPVYITPTHIYLKHRDWFSPYIPIHEAVQAGIIDPRKNRFIYNDNFGSVVLRCEAWLRMPLSLLSSDLGLIPALGLCLELERTLDMPESTLCNHDWQHMFEELIKLCSKITPKKTPPSNHEQTHLRHLQILPTI